MQHVESNKECIASIPLFDALLPCDIDTIASFSTIRTYGQGDVLFYEKDDKDVIYYIISGSIKFTKLTDLTMRYFCINSILILSFTMFPSSPIAFLSTVMLMLSF